MSMEEFKPNYDPSDGEAPTQKNVALVIEVPTGSHALPRRHRLLATSIARIEKVRKDIIACVEEGIAKTQEYKLKIK